MPKGGKAQALIGARTRFGEEADAETNAVVPQVTDRDCAEGVRVDNEDSGGRAAWNAVQRALCSRIGEDRFRRWFSFTRFERAMGAELHGSADPETPGAPTKDFPITESSSPKMTPKADSESAPGGGDVVVLGVPNLFIRDWIERRYLDELREVCREHVGIGDVRLRVVGELFRQFRSAEKEFLAEKKTALEAIGEPGSGGYAIPPDVDPETLFPTQPGPRTAPGEREKPAPVESPETRSASAGNGTPETIAAALEQLELPGARTRTSRPGALRQLDDRLTLERLVVGRCNHVAYNAGLSALHQPGGNYNPLFIYGGSGLGKTHLLQGLTRASYAGGQRRVLYLSCEEFANRFIRAVRERNVESFRAELSGLRLLVIDDVQMLRNKTQTQQSLLQTLDTIASNGAQMILASDTRPQDIDGLQGQLQGRFVSGLVCRVTVPDYPTRVAILHREARRLKIRLRDEVLHVIAEMRHGNVRELIGGLVQVHAESSLVTAPVTESRVQEILERSSGADPRGVTLDAIVIVVARHHGMTAADLVSPSRARSVSAARQVAMHLARELTDRSLSEIGGHFGRNHSTVKFSLRRIAERLETDPTLSERLDSLARELR